MYSCATLSCPTLCPPLITSMLGTISALADVRVYQSLTAGSVYKSPKPLERAAAHLCGLTDEQCTTHLLCLYPVNLLHVLTWLPIPTLSLLRNPTVTVLGYGYVAPFMQCSRDSHLSSHTQTQRTGRFSLNYTSNPCAQ